MKIDTTQKNSIPALPYKPAAPAPRPDWRPLGGSTVGNVAYQFGVQNSQSSLFQGAGGSAAEAGVQILRVLSKHIAGALPHAKWATGIVNTFWFSFDVRNRVIAARSPGVSRLAKALIGAGLAAEAATMIADWFEIRGVDQAAAVVSFVAKHGDHSTLGTVEISTEDANAFAEELVGLGDLTEVRDALRALASGSN